MNKAEFVRAIADQLADMEEPASLKSIDLFVTVFTDVVKKTVASGEKVNLVNFGRFEPRVRQEREGRNPQTGEKTTIPQQTVPTFAAGKEFKELVKGGNGKFPFV